MRGDDGRSAGGGGGDTYNLAVSDPSRSTATWVLTGMSGAGKTTALRALEAAGVECVDNLPVRLLARFAAGAGGLPSVAVIDARQGEALTSVPVLAEVGVLFLDAPDAVLVRRLAESTRPHPCAAAGAGAAAVTAERLLLTPLRAAADAVVDTGELTDAELAERVLALVVPAAGGADAGLTLTLSSFGYKFGPQVEADWVVDSRLLANPFWVDELRPLTGLDQRVRDYVMGHADSVELVHRQAELLEWVVARSRERGRRALHVAVGCTGGRHRSVVVAQELSRRLEASGSRVTLRHRDVHRPDPR